MHRAISCEMYFKIDFNQAEVLNKAEVGDPNPKKFEAQVILKSTYLNCKKHYRDRFSFRGSGWSLYTDEKGGERQFGRPSEAKEEIRRAGNRGSGGANPRRS